MHRIYYVKQIFLKEIMVYFLVSHNEFQRKAFIAHLFNQGFYGPSLISRQIIKMLT